MINGRDKIKSGIDTVTRKFATNSDKENGQPNLLENQQHQQPQINFKKLESKQSYSTTLTTLSPPSQEARFFESSNFSQGNSDAISEQSSQKPRIKKTLRLSSDKIQSFNLKPGINTITYIVHSRLQGTQKMTANIYLWNHYSKIIVTDIDGTVTKYFYK